MDVMPFRHPGLSLEREKDGLRIVLPVKPQKYRQLLHLIWMWVWLAGEAVLTASWFGSRIVPAPPPPPLFLAAFTALFTLAGFYVLFRWLWYWRGREELQVSPEALALRRGIPGFIRSRIFDHPQVTGIYARPLAYTAIYPSWGRMFIGHGNGQLVFVVRGKDMAYGRGLELEEAVSLAALLQEACTIRSNRARVAPAS